MSAIPPNWLGSIIQTQGAAARAAEQQRQEEVAQADNTGTRRGGETQDMIENADRDGQVYSDAEGRSSAGRPFEALAEETRKNVDDEGGSSAGGALDLRA